jgi:predicted transposase/invertase (TIGR01784 family)
MLTDALEMHYIEMTKWRKLKEKDINDPLHRWMVYFDERSEPGLVEEVVKMDSAIQATEEMMAMIRRDPALLHAYDMFELTRIDYKLGIQGARQEGRQEGERKGRKEGERKGRKEEKREIAKNLKAIGVAVEQIVLATGLSAGEIEKL